MSTPTGPTLRLTSPADGLVTVSADHYVNGVFTMIAHGQGVSTCYLHQSKRLVRQGDAVKRGQVIAKSGQSGEVSSPQLHFEIRKGSTPVDPLKFLNGA